jgi:catechol 2,3-dioxygenase-like lactoylglutathione lyase family enzyme
MLGMSEVFASFSVDDIGAAKRFYGDTLGLDVAGGGDDRGPLWLQVAGRRSVLIYPKPDHTPAAFTVLNVMVDDIERAVDDLVTRGVLIDTFDAYESDARGIHRAGGHSVAWFRDPAGNVVSVGQEH